MKTTPVFRMFAAGILLVLSLAARAQGNDDTRTAGPVKFAITSFGQDPFDTSPTNKEYEKIDGNGARYAIIKVTSTNPEDDLRAYRFNFGNLKSIVEEHNGQLWVYVQRNAKMVTITREGYATIDKHDLGVTIESGKTYTMQLSSAAKPVYSQTVMFSVKPADSKARVMVKSIDPNAREEEFGVINAATGMVAKSLPLGTYTYRVLADNYNASEGRITLNDRNNMHIEGVTLNDSALYTFRSQPEGAKLYLTGKSMYDETSENTNLLGMLELRKKGKYMGVTPYTVKLPGGDYTLTLKHERYKTLTERIHVARNNPEMDYTMQTRAGYHKPTTGYIFGSFFAGTTWGIHVGIGAYIHNINVELSIPFNYGTCAYMYTSPYGSDNFRTLSVYQSYMIGSEKYKPSIDARLGYGFIIKERLRITPQLGYLFMPMDIYYYRDPNNIDDIIPIHAITIGARMEFALRSYFGIFMSPVAQFAIKKSPFFLQDYVTDYWQYQDERWGNIYDFEKAGTDFYVQFGLYFNI